MAARVARGYGRPFGWVLDEPWAEVLAADLALDEVERVDQVQGSFERLELAEYVALAVNAPKALAGVRRELTGRLRRATAADTARQREQLEAIERVVRIERRRRRRQAREKGET